MAGVEVGEEVRGHLRSQGINVLGRGAVVERLSVDELEWPRSYPQNEIVASQLIASLNDHAKSEVSKGTADVCIHFNCGHDNTSYMQLPPARRKPGHA